MAKYYDSDKNDVRCLRTYVCDLSLLDIANLYSLSSDFLKERFKKLDIDWSSNNWSNNEWDNEDEKGKS